MSAVDGGSIGFLTDFLGGKLRAPHMDPEKIERRFAGFKHLEKALKIALGGVPVAVGQGGD